MLAGLRQVLMAPATGPIAASIAFALAVALGVMASEHGRRTADYEARIASLTQAAERTRLTLRAELNACQAGAAARQAEATAPAATATATPLGARRLLEQQPEGIDACARMESADRAVLSNLKK